jgi:prepilin-type N-terminal cleavage/methylation domain-containing protein
MKKMNKKGFTLVEIMIVVAIIGLLAAIGIPSFSKARSNSREKTCLNNQRIIDAAKEQDALENNLDAGEAAANYLDYIKGGADPVCPSGGAYTVGNIDTDPSCSDHGALL